MSEIKQIVPQSRELRNEIRTKARALVKGMKLLPPQTLSSLKTLASRLITDESCYENYAAIILNNALWENYFQHIPVNKRLLLLPFCLRKQPDCQAPRDDLGLICTNCGKCSIPNLSAHADALGMPVLVAESSSTVADWVERGDIQAVVGVSCLESLEKAFPAMLRSAVPGIAVPLTRDGCKDTAFDLAELNEAMAIPENADTFDSPYAAIKNHITSLFSAPNAEKYLQAGILLDEALHALCAHGKHYRPQIALGCYAALTGSPELPQFLNPVALAVECFHKASLIHDDIEDGDATRYGAPTVHARLGIPAAINIGDYLVGEGYRLFGHKSVPEELRAPMIAEAAQAHCELAQGQAREFEALNHKVSMDECMETLRLKTSPAFRVALYAGAIGAGRFAEHKKLFRHFSDLLGIAYQLFDDLEDTEENPSSTVDIAMRSIGMNRQDARTYITSLYEKHRKEIYVLLEEVKDTTLKIFLYRLAGKVLKDV